jgi:hypothetical protein
VCFCAALFLFSSQKRMAMQYPIKRRAAEFGVELPASFASWQIHPRNKAKHLLTTSM